MDRRGQHRGVDYTPHPDAVTPHTHLTPLSENVKWSYHVEHSSWEEYQAAVAERLRNMTDAERMAWSRAAMRRGLHPKKKRPSRKQKRRA